MEKSLNQKISGYNVNCGIDYDDSSFTNTSVKCRTVIEKHHQSGMMTVLLVMVVFLATGQQKTMEQVLVAGLILESLPYIKEQQQNHLVLVSSIVLVLVIVIIGEIMVQVKLIVVMQ